MTAQGKLSSDSEKSQPVRIGDVLISSSALQKGQCGCGLVLNRNIQIQQICCIRGQPSLRDHSVEVRNRLLLMLLKSSEATASETGAATIQLEQTQTTLSPSKTLSP